MSFEKRDDRVWPWLLLTASVAGLCFGVSALLSTSDNALAEGFEYGAWFMFVLGAAVSTMLAFVAVVRLADAAWALARGRAD